jgi:hypothetical protein
MFIRPVHVIKNGNRHAYLALVESYRTKRGPRQRTVAYLGQADKQGRLGLKQAATGAGRCYQRQLFDDIEPDWVQVDTKRIRVERCLDFGGPWLALWLLNRLGLDAPTGSVVTERTGRDSLVIDGPCAGDRSLLRPIQ